jgi:hypothetical protein
MPFRFGFRTSSRAYPLRENPLAPNAALAHGQRHAVRDARLTVSANGEAAAQRLNRSPVYAPNEIGATSMRRDVEPVGCAALVACPVLRVGVGRYVICRTR